VDSSIVTKEDLSSAPVRDCLWRRSHDSVLVGTTIELSVGVVSNSVRTFVVKSDCFFRIRGLLLDIEFGIAGEMNFAAIEGDVNVMAPSVICRAILVCISSICSVGTNYFVLE